MNSGLQPVRVISEWAVEIRLSKEADHSDLGWARKIGDRLLRQPFPGFIEAVPALESMVVLLDPIAVRAAELGRRDKHRVGERILSRWDFAADGTAAEQVADWISRMLSDGEPGVPSDGLGTIVELPVCYGGEHGPDLKALAAACGISERDVVNLHSEPLYQVGMIGFLPGFPYLTGLDERLHAARRDVPRVAVPAGSVGIGGTQTGVYPVRSPGGWQLIGRTPLRLLRPQREPPVLLEAGDRVRFVPISAERFAELEREELAAAGKYGLAKQEPEGEYSGAKRGGLAVVGEADTVVRREQESAGEFVTVARRELESAGQFAGAMREDVDFTGEFAGTIRGNMENDLGPEGGNKAFVEVLRGGLWTTVQDGGRRFYRRYGVPWSGALDVWALRRANVLVGNAPDNAALECTLSGPELRFRQMAVFAVCGGEFELRLDGKPVPSDRPVLARAGSVLRVGRAAHGCRAYVALAGGIATPPALGSRSTDVRSGLGGLQGTALQPGASLPLGAPSPIGAALQRQLRERGPAAWGAGPGFAAGARRGGMGAQPPREAAVLRYVRGPEWAALAPAAAAALAAAAWAVLPESDRMGIRLHGSEPLQQASAAGAMLSEPVLPGTIQLPPSGQPVLLLADGQTTGGYPRIAQVAFADLCTAAQLRPGCHVRLQEITLAESEALWLEQARQFRLVQAGVRLKLKQRQF